MNNYWKETARKKEKKKPHWLICVFVLSPGLSALTILSYSRLSRVISHVVRQFSLCCFWQFPCSRHLYCDYFLPIFLTDDLFAPQVTSCIIAPVNNALVLFLPLVCCLVGFSFSVCLVSDQTRIWFQLRSLFKVDQTGLRWMYGEKFRGEAQDHPC